MSKTGKKSKALGLFQLLPLIVSGLFNLLRSIPYVLLLLLYCLASWFHGVPKLSLGKRWETIERKEKEDGPYLNGTPVRKMQTLGELNDICGMQLKKVPEADVISNESEQEVDIEPKNGNGQSVHVGVRKPDGKEDDDIDIEGWTVVHIEGREDSEGLLCLYKGGIEVTVGLRLSQVVEAFGKPDWSEWNLKFEIWTYGYDYFRVHAFGKKRINAIEVSMASWTRKSLETSIEKDSGSTSGSRKEGVYLNGARICKASTVRELMDTCNMQLGYWPTKEWVSIEVGLSEAGQMAILETKDGWHEEIVINIRKPKGKEYDAIDVKDWIVTDIKADNELVGLYRDGEKIEVGMKVSRALEVLGRPDWSERKRKSMTYGYGCFELYAHKKKWISCINVSLERIEKLV